MESKSYKLMIPGPVEVSEEVLHAMGSQVQPHYGPDWTAFYNETLTLLRKSSTPPVMCSSWWDPVRWRSTPVWAVLSRRVKRSSSEIMAFLVTGWSRLPKRMA